LDEKQVMWAIFSLVGQLLHTMHIQGILSNQSDGEFASVFEVSSAIDHIVPFTVAGVEALIA